MIIKRVKLTNIRSYLRETIEFPEGSVLISGDIGSGKTTILLAIEFALFGIQKGQLSGEALLRNGSASGSVELHLSMNGGNIIIHRKLKRSRNGVNQGAGYIIEENQKFEGSPTELKARVFEILGYPRSVMSKSKNMIFRYTVYTPQEAMKRILTDDSEVRLDTLRRVFNIDRYKRVKENALILVKYLKGEKARLEGMAEGLDQKRNELQEARNRMEAAEKELKALLPEEEETAKLLSEKREEAALIHEELRDAQKAREKLAELSRRIEEIVGDYSRDREALAEALSDEKRRAEELEVMKKSIPSGFAGEDEEKLRRKLGELRELENRARSERGRLEERARHVEKELERLRGEIERFNPEKLAEAEEKVKQITERIEELSGVAGRRAEKERAIAKLESELENEVEMLSKSRMLIAEIEKMVVCPTCKQKVDEEHKGIIRKEEEDRQRVLQEKMTALKENLAIQKRTLEEALRAEREIEQLNRALSELRSAIAAMEEQKRQAEMNMRRRRELEEEFGKLKAELAEKRGPGKTSDRIKEIEDYLETMVRIKQAELELAAAQEKARTINEQLKRSKKELGRVNEEKRILSSKAEEEEALLEKYARKKRELEEIEAKAKELSEMKGKLEQEITSLAEQVGKSEKEVSEKEEAERNAERIGNRIRWLGDFFVKLVDVIERQVMLTVHNEFNELFVKWFDVLIQDDTLQAKLDDTFTPVVVQNGYDADVKHMSGGERTALALAYRLALNRVINDLIRGIKTRDLLILDEPTDGFSSEQLDNVRSVLEELPNRQVIIVSHEPKVETFVQHIIRISKQEHSSHAEHSV